MTFGLLPEEFTSRRLHTCGSQAGAPLAEVPVAPGVACICTSFHWPCMSDLVTSVKEAAKRRRAYETSVNAGCISTSRGCYLTIYFVAFRALTGNTQSVSHQFKSQYLLLNVLL